MKQAVIVSTARSGLAKSFRGSFNMTHGATLGAHSVEHAVKRADIDPSTVEDVLMGCATPEGATGGNIARQIALRAGMPESVCGIVFVQVVCKQSRWLRRAFRTALGRWLLAALKASL